MPFQDGMVVYLKSGGPPMTVVGTQPDGKVDVSWNVGTALNAARFPEAALVERNPAPAIANETAKVQREIDAANPPPPSLSVEAAAVR